MRKGRKRPDLKHARKMTADANLMRWRSLTTMQQLHELDDRLGKGSGATQQRARLITQQLEAMT